MITVGVKPNGKLANGLCGFSSRYILNCCMTSMFPWSALLDLANLPH